MEHQKTGAGAVAHVHAAHGGGRGFQFFQRRGLAADHTLAHQPAVQVLRIGLAQGVAHIVLAAHLHRHRHARLRNVGLRKFLSQTCPQHAVNTRKRQGLGVGVVVHRGFNTQVGRKRRERARGHIVFSAKQVQCGVNVAMQVQHKVGVAAEFLHLHAQGAQLVQGLQRFEAVLRGFADGAHIGLGVCAQLAAHALGHGIGQVDPVAVEVFVA